MAPQPVDFEGNSGTIPSGVDTVGTHGHPTLVTADGTVIQPDSVVNVGGPYQIAGNFDFSGNEALAELSSALGRLSGQATDNTLSMVDGMSTKLGSAAYRASDISSKFRGVNNSISVSWDSVADFANKINDRVTALTRNFTEELQQFIMVTQEHDAEIQQATSTANELASELLTKLGLQ